MPLRAHESAVTCAANGVDLREPLQPAPVADAPVGADLAQPLDRVRTLAAEVALDLEVGVDVVAERGDLVLGEVAHLRVGRESERRADLARARLPDAVDVREPDLQA